MQIGMVGLGRMGANMVRRLLRGGHNAIVFDLSPDNVKQVEADGADIAEVWRRGSVVGSWLLDLTSMALTENPTLDSFSGFVQDSGEGRWMVMTAVEEAVPAPVLSASAVLAFPLAPGAHLCRQGAVGHAQQIRRPRRAADRRLAIVASRDRKYL